MKYYKNELGHVVGIPDKMWPRLIKLQPKIQELEQEVEFDKLQDDADTGIGSKGETPQKQRTVRSDASDVGKDKPKPRRKKAVPKSTTAQSKGRGTK